MTDFDFNIAMHDNRQFDGKPGGGIGILTSYYDVILDPSAVVAAAQYVIAVNELQYY